jgi:hypothetical protein
VKDPLLASLAQVSQTMRDEIPATLAQYPVQAQTPAKRPSATRRMLAAAP